MPAVGFRSLQKTKADLLVRRLARGQVGLICQLVFHAVGVGTSQVFRRVPFGVPWFRPVRAGQGVVASCWVLPVFSGGCPVVEVVVAGWLVCFGFPSMVWQASRATRQGDALAKTG